LCRRGDARGVEQAIAWLDQPLSTDLELGLRALREPMLSDRELAERVLSRLLDRAARDANAERSDRASTWQAIGQVPHEKAARFLLDLAERETEPIQGFPAHRWLCLQVANTREAGAPLVVERLSRERDPSKRIDLIEALAAPGGDRARDELATLLQGDSLSPYEILYVAERSITLGPAKRVAPLVKRATLRVQQGDVRLALQCLLWSSYPAPER
jgi:hypothetical protein